MYQLAGGAILGVALGSNDAANVFGTAVASKMVRFRTAAIITAAFVIAGAVVGGERGLVTLGGLSHQTARTAMIVTALAGASVLAMNALKLPVSSSQAMVGAIMGMALATSPGSVQWSDLVKIVACWVGTPIGAAVIAAVLYPLLGWVVDRLPLGIVGRSILLRSALLVSGAYGAFALGANNVANVTGVFYNTPVASSFADPALVLALFGSGAIALGAVALGRNVMVTVGSRLVQLGAFSAFVVVLSQAITVDIYARVGVPVSASQAVVGAVLGIGLAKSVRTINKATLPRIVAAWVLTPALAGGASFLVGLATS
jgi:PiT family inorganic phosphate transporter